MKRSAVIFERSELGQSGLRLSIVGIVIASLFVALFARLLFLQLVESPKFVAAAQANQVRVVYDEAPRGRILDRNGDVLVGNREVDVITAEREAVKKDPTLLDRLAVVTHTEPGQLHAAMDDPKASPYRPVPILRAVDKELVATLRERASEFPGISATTRVERWYPSGNLAVHVIGYLGEVNETELAARRDEGYRLGDSIGKSGIEAAFESDLRGRPGVDKIEVDASGRPVRVLEHTPPVPGNDVHLSIDKFVQLAAESSLEQGLALARQAVTGGSAEQAGARAGSVVALDPRNGEILAMASFPTYDLASFNRGIRVDEYAALTDPKGALPLTNRAISGQYAPGSTFKLITAVAGLRTGMITPHTTVVDTGAFFLGTQRFQNAQGRSYGPVDIRRALTVSSDVFFYSLGARFWEARKNTPNPIQATATDFGLGVKLGVPLAGEAAGRIPSPESRKKLHEQRPDAYPEGNWYGGDNVNLAIGQGDTLVTPVQLASAYATFANGGDLRLPLLVTSVSDPRGRPVQPINPQTLRHVDLAPGLHGPIEQGLSDAVKLPSGTAHAAFNGFDLDAFPVAGKTGTAQVNERHDTALFAGYGPVGNPRIAVSVVMEESGFGGAAAAPVARRVFAAVAGQPQPQSATRGSDLD